MLSNPHYLLLSLLFCAVAAVSGTAAHYRYERSVDHTGHQHPPLPVNIDWLTEDQHSQLDNADHDILAQVTKLRHFYDQLADNSQEKLSAARNIVGQCYSWLTKEERHSLQQLHHTDHNACKEKVNEYIGRLPDEKQTELRKYWPFCEHVFYDTHVELVEHEGHSSHDHHSVPHHLTGGGQEAAAAPVTRFRRDHHEGHTHEGHRLEDYFKSHLSWLNDDQKEALRTMKTEGKSVSDIQERVFEYFEASSGDTKEKASELLKGGCRELLAKVVGPEKAQELKVLKESGASMSDLRKKVDQLVSEVTDEHKKGLAEQFGPFCRKIFAVAEASAPATARRLRRDNRQRQWDDENNQLEDQYRQQGDDGNRDWEQTPSPPASPRDGGSRRRGNDNNDFDLADHHSSWLSDSQRDHLREQKDQGADESTLHNKVLEFFHVSADGVKDMARNLLTSGCEKLLGKTFGEEKAEELKRVRADEGVEKMQNRMQEYAGEMDDEGQRAEALRFGSTCRKIFELLVRRRRSSDIGRWDRE